MAATDDWVMRVAWDICADVERAIRDHDARRARLGVDDLRESRSGERIMVVLADLDAAMERGDKRTALLLLGMVRAILKGEIHP